MAITLRAVSANPVDNTTLYDSVERSITPPASMVTGDLAILYVNRKLLASITISNTGGQSWNSGTLRQGGSNSAQVFWCRFNGTWSANPSIVTVADGTVVISLYMEAWIPTSGSNTWALDMSERYKAYTAPVSPSYDVQALFTNSNTVAASTVSTAMFQSIDVNTWQSRTAGWTNAGGAQYRNPDPAHNKPLSVSVVSQILTAAGALSSPVNRQLTNGGDLGLWITNTFKEQASGVTIASISTGATPIVDGQTSITVTCTSAGASHTGSADLIISPTNSIADAGAVTQTQTAWADTAVTFTALRSTLSRFTNAFLFIRNSSGQSNSSGFVVQFGSVATFALQVKNLAGSGDAGLSGIKYAIYPTTDVFGTAIASGSSATTDGSGNLAGLATYTLVSGGPVNVGDDVVLIPWKGGSPASASAGTIYQITPTYS